jgi:hypothetical protein
MSTETKELFVLPRESSKRIMYLAKEFLLNNEYVDVVATAQSAEIAAKVCETLLRLNYITYDDIKTETNVFNEKRRTRFSIRIRKTKEFKTLYDENIANRKKLQETSI